MAEDNPKYEDGAGDEAGDDHAPVQGADSDAHFEPVVKLKEVDVTTGEENEESIFKERAKLYRFDPSGKEWKERGTGDVKFLQDKTTHKIRALMRQEKTLKICMNHYISPGLDLKPNLGSDRAWTWATMDWSSEEPSVQTFAIKFKNPEVANAYKEQWDKAKTENQKLTSGGPAASASSAAPSSAAPAAASSNPWHQILKEGKFSKLSEEDISSLWKKYDKDGSKFIDASELSNLLSDLMDAVTKTLNPAASDEVRQKLHDAVPQLTAQAMKTLDKNADSKLSYDEFKKVDSVNMALK